MPDAQRSSFPPFSAGLVVLLTCSFEVCFAENNLDCCFSGMLENGLLQSCNQWNRRLSPTMGLTNINSDQDESEEFLEIRYHTTTPESPLSQVMGHLHNSALNLGAGGDTDYTSLNINEGEMDPCPPHRPEAPESPTIPRDASISCNDPSNLKHRNQNSSSSKTHADKPAAVAPDTRYRHCSRSNSNSSTDGAKLSVHTITKSSKHSDKRDSKSDVTQDFSYHEDDSPLTHVAAITHIESIQASAVNNDNDLMKSVKDGPGNDSKSKTRSGSGNLTLHSTTNRPDDAELIEDLDSPESISKIDREDCFSWEQDGLQLTFDHVEPQEESPKSDTIPLSMTTSRDSASESGKESLSSETNSASVSSLDRVGQASAGTKNSISSENSPSEKQRKSKAIRDKLSAAFHKSGNSSKATAKEKKEDLQVVVPKRKPDLDVILKQDEFGYPLAIFTKVSANRHLFLS